MKRVAFHTLGCKLNYSETSQIADSFLREGYRKVSLAEGPDVLFLNTCTVTEHAEKTCQRLVRQARSRKPGCLVIAAGCMAQLRPGSLLKGGIADLVLGSAEKFRAVTHLGNFLSNPSYPKVWVERDQLREFHPAVGSGDRSRSFLKVQDGCSYGCSFCTIPLARGKSRSLSIESVCLQVERLGDAGAGEVVLTGVNIGDFGVEEGRRNSSFLKLLGALDALDTKIRIRISSIEPNLLSAQIIALMASSSRFASHFHLPLQSGSDHILSSMNRRYNSSLFRERIAQIRDCMPEAAIGVDVIAGFPSEGEDDFKATYDMLREEDITYLHVFPYSVRPNTRAETMGQQIPMSLKRERAELLRRLSERKKYHFCLRQSGSTQLVLFEEGKEDRYMYGYTGNYVRVKHPRRESLVGRLVPVTLSGIDEGGCMLSQIQVNPVAPGPTTSR